MNQTVCRGFWCGRSGNSGCGCGCGCGYDCCGNPIASNPNVSNGCSCNSACDACSCCNVRVYAPAALYDEENGDDGCSCRHCCCE